MSDMSETPQTVIIHEDDSSICADFVACDRVAVAHVKVSPLMAAAPDLLAALKGLRGAFLEVCEDHKVNPRCLELTEAGAAIAKAEGQ